MRRILDASWEEMFADLVAYKDRFGDCNVAPGYPKRTKLGLWVASQRNRRKAGKLNEDRIRRLDELGFEWSRVNLQSWEEMFADLVAYKDRFGDCNVPNRWQENPKLGTWVGTQRNRRKAGKLEEDRIRRLDELGFEWNLVNLQSWEEMFADLVAYRDRFGDCNVPQRWPENTKLGTWVGTQRIRRKASKLYEDRIRRLDELGFEWGRANRKSDPS